MASGPTGGVARDSLFGAADAAGEGDGAAGSTGAKPIPTMLCGISALVVTVALAWVVRTFLADTIVGRLFSHGLISFFTAWLGLWSIWILAIKARRLAFERKALKFDVLSREDQALIRPSNVDRFSAHLEELPEEFHESLLFRRIAGSLEYFKSTRSAEGVSEYLTAQNELDAGSSESSFTMVRAFIWAIPILGFIGTVFGIGEAVNSFAVSVDAATDVEAIRSSLGGVTGGLGTAFETTLVALILSIMLMIPTNWIYKTEDDLLTNIARYCNEELTWRFERGGQVVTVAGGTGGGGSAGGQVLEGAVSQAAEQARILTQTIERSAGVLESSIDVSVQKLGEEVPEAVRGLHATLEESVRRTTEMLEAQNGMRERFEQAATAESIESLMLKIDETHNRMMDVFERMAQIKPKRWWRLWS